MLLKLWILADSSGACLSSKMFVHRRLPATSLDVWLGLSMGVFLRAKHGHVLRFLQTRLRNGVASPIFKRPVRAESWELELVLQWANVSPEPKNTLVLENRDFKHCWWRYWPFVVSAVPTWLGLCQCVSVGTLSILSAYWYPGQIWKFWKFSGRLGLLDNFEHFSRFWLEFIW